ncbi:MAG: hypothetical protein II992_13160 [Lachnospiraceae bacterium]|nr:hypothetical protein [Lachnospiraceae bacterium]
MLKYVYAILRVVDEVHMENQFKVIKKIIAGAIVSAFCICGQESVSTNKVISQHEKIMYTTYTEGETETGVEDTTDLVLEDESIYYSTYISYGTGCFFVSVEKENLKSANDVASGSGIGNLMDNTGIVSSKNLIEACFSQEEISAVASGANEELQVKISFIEPESLNQKKYSLMMEALEQYRQEFGGSLEFNLTDYIKITVSKKNDLGKWEKVNNFNNQLDIMLDIPSESQFIDAESYYLLQLQGNKAYTLIEDTDNYNELLSVSVTGSSICAMACTNVIEEPVETVAPTQRPTFWKQLNDSKFCLWHWFSISILIISMTWILAVERNKNRLIFTTIMSIISVVLAVMGSCKWDWIILVISLFLMWITNIWKITKKNK